jgi:hypothetical protein
MNSNQNHKILEYPCPAREKFLFFCLQSWLPAITFIPTSFESPPAQRHFSLHPNPQETLLSSANLLLRYSLCSGAVIR